jgi:hypothetical protein
VRWSIRRAGVPDTWTWENIFFHDLLDKDNSLLGYVREDKRPGHGFTPYTNLSEGRAQFPTQATLREAKAMLVAHFVIEKLEEPWN